MLKTAPPGNSLVVQWSRLSIVTALAQVSCLIGEVRSHKMCNQKKKKIPSWPPNHYGQPVTVVPWIWTAHAGLVHSQRPSPSDTCSLCKPSTSESDSFPIASINSWDFLHTISLQMFGWVWETWIWCLMGTILAENAVWKHVASRKFGFYKVRGWKNVHGGAILQGRLWKPGHPRIPPRGMLSWEGGALMHLHCAS